MKVCLIYNSPFNEIAGGVDRVSTILIKEFVKKGVEVFCCFPSKISTEVEICKTFYLPNNQIYSSDNVNYLKSVVEDQHIDILINQSIMMDYHYLTVAVKESTNAKLITVNHSNPVFQVKDLTDKIDKIVLFEKNVLKRFLSQVVRKMMYPLSYSIRYRDLKKMHKIKYENSDCYVLLSEEYVKQVCKILGVSKTRKICSISNPVPLIPNVDKKINKIIFEKEKIVLFVGRIVFQKRIDRLLRIWKIVQERVPDWHLVIIGDGDMCQCMEDYARRLGVERCFFEGKKDALQLMETASILCIQSTHECFPMTLVEAQQLACVPIAFDSFDAVHDIIDDNETGMLIQPFDEKQYSQSMEKLMSDDKRRVDMAVNAYHSVTKFRSDLIAAQWLELFQQLIDIEK